MESRDPEDFNTICTLCEKQIERFKKQLNKSKLTKRYFF